MIWPVIEPWSPGSLSNILTISISIVFACTQLNIKTVLFLTIQFRISTQFSSIRPIDRTQSGVTIPGQCGPGSDGNKGLLYIPQSSSITGASPSGRLISLKSSQCSLQFQPTRPGDFEFVYIYEYILSPCLGVCAHMEICMLIYI